MISPRLRPAATRTATVPQQRAAADDIPATRHRVLALLDVLPPSEVAEHDVLLDIGADTRELVADVAMRYPFRRIVGVQPRTANDPVDERIRMCGSALVCLTSAVNDLSVPDDVTIVSLPPCADQVGRVVRSLVESLRRSPRWVRVVASDASAVAALVAAGEVRLVRASRVDNTKLYLVCPS